MIFTACRGGVSHNPDEFVTPDAMVQAVAALATALAHQDMTPRLRPH